MKNIKRHLAIAVLGISLLSCSVEKNRYELIPYPNNMEQLPGRFVFDDNTNIFVAPECGNEMTNIASAFATHFNEISGKSITVTPTESGKKSLSIKLAPGRAASR